MRSSFWSSGKFGAEEMAAVAVARNGCVVPEAHFARLRRVVNESDFLLIVDIVATSELLGPVGRIAEQIEQGRNGAIVEIRRTRPYAVQRLVGVAIRFYKMRKAILAIRVELGLISRRA